MSSLTPENYLQVFVDEFHIDLELVDFENVPINVGVEQTDADGPYRMVVVEIFFAEVRDVLDTSADGGLVFEAVKTVASRIGLRVTDIQVDSVSDNARYWGLHFTFKLKDW